MRRLREILLERGLVSDEEFAEAEAIQRELGGSLGPTLVRIGAMSEDSLLSVLSEQVGMPVLATAAAPSVEAVRDAARGLNVPVSWLVDNETLVWRVVQKDTDVLCVAGPRIHDPWVQESIEQWRQASVRLYLAS